MTDHNSKAENGNDGVDSKVGEATPLGRVDGLFKDIEEKSTSRRLQRRLEEGAAALKIKREKELEEKLRNNAAILEKSGCNPNTPTNVVASQPSKGRKKPAIYHKRGLPEKVVLEHGPFGEGDMLKNAWKCYVDGDIKAMTDYLNKMDNFLSGKGRKRPEAFATWYKEMRAVAKSIEYATKDSLNSNLSDMEKMICFVEKVYKSKDRAVPEKFKEIVYGIRRVGYFDYLGDLFQEAVALGVNGESDETAKSIGKLTNRLYMAGLNAVAGLVKDVISKVKKHEYGERVEFLKEISAVREYFYKTMLNITKEPPNDSSIDGVIEKVAKKYSDIADKCAKVLGKEVR